MDKSIEETRRRHKRQVVRISTIRDTIMNYKKTPFYKTKSISDKKGQEIAPSVRDSALSQNDNTDKSELPINFDNYDFSVFLNKKTEKLTVALYMVTSFLSDNEPLKWRLREKSIVLLSGITTARDKSVSEMENVFASHSFLVEEIISFLEVGAASKLISEMNFSILKAEYMALRTLVLDPSMLILSENHLTVTKDDIESAERKAPQSPMSIKDIYKRQPLKSSSQKIGAVSTSNASRTQITKPRYFKERDSRRQLIINFIRHNGEVSIKDILRESTISSGVSSKTIQRELIDMVSGGILNKTGERRWSKYSLV